MNMKKELFISGRCSEEQHCSVNVIMCVVAGYDDNILQLWYYTTYD